MLARVVVGQAAVAGLGYVVGGAAGHGALLARLRAHHSRCAQALSSRHGWQRQPCLYLAWVPCSGASGAHRDSAPTAFLSRRTVRSWMPSRAAMRRSGTPSAAMSATT